MTLLNVTSTIRHSIVQTWSGLRNGSQDAAVHHHVGDHPVRSDFFQRFAEFRDRYLGGAHASRSQSRQFDAKSTVGKSSRSAHIDVPFGKLRTVHDTEILTTTGLFDCCAIAFLSNFDEEKGVFRDRTMMHVLGSDLRTAVSDPHGETNTANQAIQQLLASRTGSRHKLIVGFGLLSSSDYARESLLTSEHDGRQLIGEYAKACGYEHIELQANSGTLQVAPDGRILSTHDGDGTVTRISDPQQVQAEFGN
jgi:hypothetical protein